MRLVMLAALLWLLFAGVLGFQVAKLTEPPPASTHSRDTERSQARASTDVKTKQMGKRLSQSATSPLRPSVIAENALLALVSIDVVAPFAGPQSSGSGFFVASDLVATCYHVIEKASSVTEISIRSVYDGRIFKARWAEEIDAERDLAIIRVAVTGDERRALSLGSAAPGVGDRVFTLGNPQGFEGSFSDGVVSAVREGDSTIYLQVTTPISAGSSGGPVLNEQGQVLGVIALSANRAQNVNFAVSSLHLRGMLEGHLGAGTH